MNTYQDLIKFYNLETTFEKTLLTSKDNLEKPKLTDLNLKKLKKYLEFLVPCSFKVSFPKRVTVISILKFSIPETVTLLWRNHKVTSIKYLCIESYFRGIPPLYQIFQLTLNRSEKYLCNFPNQLMNRDKIRDKLYKLISDYGVWDQTFVCTTERTSPIWLEAPVSCIYTKEEKGYYDQSYGFIKTAIKEIITDLKGKKVLLFSGGCGDGTDLQEVKGAFDGCRNLQVCGVDYNPKNISEAQLKNPSGLFICGSLVDFPHQLECMLRKFLSIPGEKSYKVMLFSGVLTRHVLNGSVEASLIMQQASREADLVVISGLTPLLINSRAAKAIGYHIQKIDTFKASTADNAQKVHNPIFYLTLQKENERISYILHRSQKRKRQGKPLDLSLSGNPLRDFHLIVMEQPEWLAEITQLDISWCYFKDSAEVLSFAIELQKLQKLSTIIISVTETKWLDTFKQRTGNKYRLCIRDDTLNEFEIPTFSVSFARRIGNFDQLPVIRR